MTKMQQKPDRADELRRALTAIRNLKERVRHLESRAGEPIAVVGMACRLPGGADTPEKLWALLRDGVDATSEVPADRWDVESLYDPDLEAVGRIYVKRGGFLEGPVDRFDAAFFGISPREAEVMDPVQRLLLELSWEALERSGTPPHSLEGSDTGVFVGLAGSEFEGFQHLHGVHLDDVHAYRGLGSASSVSGGRISHVLGLHGPNMSIDTACSSSLVATVLAVENLRSGRCSVALAGGVQLMFGPGPTMFLCRLRALSPGGRCRTFDAGADGYARGEGGAMFVLKRLADAQADGDRIHAVIRGGAVNHDGHSSGLTVPNPLAQRAVIASALRDAGLEPAQIDYIEAHGTATPLGDPIEIRALADAVARHKTNERPLLLGSLKTNVGHSEAAAGAAGLLKTVLSLEHGFIPPHLNFDEPTPHVDWASLPIQVVQALTPWPGDDGPWRAGVSAFGFSGTNAHLIVESAPPDVPTAVPASRDAELIVVSGKTRGAVRELARSLSEHVLEVGDEGLPDVAYTLAVARSPMVMRGAVVTGSAAEVGAGLAGLASGPDESIEQTRLGSGGRLAMLFTGQGAQYPGMARGLIRGSEIFRSEIERCDAILKGHLDRSLLSLLLEEDDPSVLRRTAYAQPALFAVEHALATLWRSWGIEPSVVAGHSLGEYVAAVVAGVMDLTDALPLVALRGRLMQELPEGGAMVSIEAPEDRVAERVAEVAGAGIAASNGPLNTVISGDQEAVHKVSSSFECEGVRCRELEVSHAFHSHRMDPMLAPFERAIASVPLRVPSLGLVSNLTGSVLTPEDAVDPSRWRRHIREGVRFHASMQTLSDLGTKTYLEIGPHPTLLALGAAGLPGSEFRWLPSMRRGQGQWHCLLTTLGDLFKAGYDIDWRAYGSDRGGRLADIPTYGFQRERHWPTFGRARSRGGIAGTDEVHPLIGAPLHSPAIEGWVFQQTLDEGSPSYLSDHRFEGVVIVPAAAFVEMAMAAVEHGPRWKDTAIEALTFEQPLLIPEGEAVVVQTILSGERESARVRIVARPLDGSRPEWSVVATARVVPGMPTLDQSAMDAWSRPAQVVDMGHIYDKLEDRGLRYGSAFRVVDEAHADDRCAVGRLSLASREARDASAYAVHPAVIDSGLHLIGAILDGNPKYLKSYLPFSFDRIQFTGAAGSTCGVRVLLREEGDQAQNGDVPKADLAFVDEAGTVIGMAEGYQARKASLTRGSRLDRNTYTVAWHPMAPPEELVEPDGRWLLLDGGGDTPTRVAEMLEACGTEVERVPCARAGDVEDAIRSLSGSFRGVVHACSLEVDDVTTGQSEAIARALLPLVHLLAEQRVVEGGRFLFLTRGAQGPRRGSGDVSLKGGALWGAFAAFRAERAEFPSRIVDLDPYRPPDPGLLKAALFGAGEEDRIALRDGSVLAARLVRRAGSQESRTPGVVPAENYRLEIERRGALEDVVHSPSVRTPPEPGMVEVKVIATGLNFRDVLNVLGQYPGDPGPPGLEFSGVVERVGAGVDDVSPGDEVVGMHSAMFTAYTTLPVTSIVPKPVSLTHEEAATIPVAFMTAEWGLRHLGRISPGDRVLIHAGTGGVGQAAIQVALAAGAEVFTTAGSDVKRSFLREQGVEHVFDSRSPSFYQGILDATEGAGVDIVLNSLTGELLQRSLDLLHEGGRFIELGKMELFDPEQMAAERGIEYAAFELGTIPLSTEEYRDFFHSVAVRFDEGALSALPVRVFPADEIVDALRFMAQARHIGKIAIRSALVRPHDPIRSDGSYVVTGATGGIGPQVVEWLFRRGAGAVIASSRSEPAGEVAEAFERLRDEGAAVSFEAADVSRAVDVERVLARARSSGHPIRGVFHAAGVLDDRMIQDLDEEGVRRVLAPKVDGALALHRATREDDLDHFVLFSSAAALVGGAGQAAYAAANAFLDTLAYGRRRKGLPALSIEWGAWGGSGMAHRLDDRQRQAMERAGTRFLDPDDALDTLEALLGAPDTSVMVATVDWEAVTRTGAHVPTFVRDLGSSRGVSAREDNRVDRRELMAMDAEARAERVQAFVTSTLAAVLGLSPDQLEMDTVVGALGFDSLMAVEFRNRVDAELNITLPTGDLLAGGTVAEVTQLLTLRLDVGDLGEIPGVEAETLETFEI